MLCDYYEEGLNLKSIQHYWQSVGLKGQQNFYQFFNERIIIKDRNEELSNEITDYRDIFKQQTNYKSIILMGEPGTGKSTLVEEITRQWMSPGSFMRSKFGLVVLIRLDEIDEKTTLENLVSKLFDKKRAETFLELLENFEFQKQMLFIFDGYDQYPLGMCKEVEDIMNKGKIPRATTLVTTRPSSYKSGYQFGTVRSQCTLHLLGFSEEGIETQVKKLCF